MISIDCSSTYKKTYHSDEQQQLTMPMSLEERICRDFYQSFQDFAACVNTGENLKTFKMLI